LRVIRELANPMIHALLFTILLLICAGILILSIPYCNRLKQSAVEAFARLSGRSLKGTVYLFYIFVGLLFVGQIFEIMSIKAADFTDPLRAERLLSAQRDAYLAGSVLMLFLCMSKIYKLIRESNKLKASKEAILRQARNAASFARNPLEEKIASNNKIKNNEVAKSNTKKATSDKNQAAALLKLRVEKKKLETDLKTLKSQSDAQSKEYMRLVKENKSLTTQLKDFELLMGDKKKKIV